MQKPAETSAPIHALLKARWSPRAFSEQAIAPETLASLLEAARWAASSRNEQPWRFLVTICGQGDGYQKLLACLSERNQPWARLAPVLILTTAKKIFARNNDLNRHAFHDVGLAVAQLTIQAASRQLFVHQIAGFSVEAARREFVIPEPFDPLTVLAVGYYGAPDDLLADRKKQELGPRRRLPLGEIAFQEEWDRAFVWNANPGLRSEPAE